MSFFGLSGDTTFMVGVEDHDDPPGSLRVYVGHRYKNIYCIVDDEDAKRDVLRAWGHGGHVLMPLPPADRLYCADPEAVSHAT